jgi:uncharacterized protein YjbI with pentapeptide repeats
MFRKQIISLQPKPIPLFLDEEHNEELFDYQYYRQDKMHTLMIKIFNNKLVGSSFQRRLSIDLIRELKKSEEYADIASKINNNQKVHSLEYAFFVLLTSDVNQLDVEMLKRLQSIIKKESASVEGMKEIRDTFTYYQQVMNSNLDILIRVRAWQSAEFESVKKYLIKEIKSLLISGPAYLNMQNVDLRCADLSNMHFYQGFFDGAKFNEANLHGTRFYDSSLENVDMRGITCIKAGEKWEPEIHSCRLSQAMLDGISLRTFFSEVTGSSLINAEVIGSAKFTQCNLTGCILMLSSHGLATEFLQCDMSGAILEFPRQWPYIKMDQVKLFNDSVFTAADFQNVVEKQIKPFVESEIEKIKSLTISCSGWLNNKNESEEKNIASMHFCVAGSIVYSLDCLAIPLETKEFILKSARDFFLTRHATLMKVASAFFYSMFAPVEAGKNIYQSEAVRVLSEAHRRIATEASVPRLF